MMRFARGLAVMVLVASSLSARANGLLGRPRTAVAYYYYPVVVAHVPPLAYTPCPPYAPAAHVTELTTPPLIPRAVSPAPKPAPAGAGFAPPTAAPPSTGPVSPEPPLANPPRKDSGSPR